VGHEKGTKTGYEHYQGFVVFETTKSAMQVKSKLTDQTHVEISRESSKKCIEYCRKEHRIRYEKNIQSYAPVEKVRSGRNDDHWRELIKDCERMEADEIREKYPKDWVLRRTVIERMITEASAKNARIWGGLLQQKNFWIWGDPGVGKSRWAIEQIAMPNVLRKNNNKWWCNYHCSDTRLVILEDYPALPQGDALQYHMKVWADRYPFLGEIKGGGVIIEPGRFAIVVTSNYRIEECFSKEQDRKALLRRFREIQMTKSNKSLIESLKIDFQILTKRKKQTEEQEPGTKEETDEEIDEWMNHEKEVEEMQQESRERAEKGLDEEEEW
jgi:hypothetical protein